MTNFEYIKSLDMEEFSNTLAFLVLGGFLRGNDPKEILSCEAFGELAANYREYLKKEKE